MSTQQQDAQFIESEVKNLAQNLLEGKIQVMRDGVKLFAGRIPPAMMEMFIERNKAQWLADFTAQADVVVRRKLARKAAEKAAAEAAAAPAPAPKPALADRMSRFAGLVKQELGKTLANAGLVPAAAAPAPVAVAAPAPAPVEESWISYPVESESFFVSDKSLDGKYRYGFAKGHEPPYSALSTTAPWYVRDESPSIEYISQQDRPLSESLVKKEGLCVYKNLRNLMLLAIPGGEYRDIELRVIVRNTISSNHAERIGEVLLNKFQEHLAKIGARVFTNIPLSSVFGALGKAAEMLNRVKVFIPDNEINVALVIDQALYLIATTPGLNEGFDHASWKRFQIAPLTSDSYHAWVSKENPDVFQLHPHGMGRVRRTALESEIAANTELVNQAKRVFEAELRKDHSGNNQAQKNANWFRRIIDDLDPKHFENMSGYQKFHIEHYVKDPLSLLASADIQDAYRKIFERPLPQVPDVKLPAPAPATNEAKEKAEFKAAVTSTTPTPGPKFRYGLVMRPAAYASIPNYFYSTEKVPENQNVYIRHGLVVYDKQLTPDEVYSYELAVYKTPEEILNLAMPREIERFNEYVDMMKDDARGIGEDLIAQMFYDELAENHARVFSNAPLKALMDIMGQSAVMLYNVRNQLPAQKITKDQMVRQSLYLLATDKREFDKDWTQGQIIPVDKANLNPVVLREQPSKVFVAPVAVAAPTPAVPSLTPEQLAVRDKLEARRVAAERTRLEFEATVKQTTPTAGKYRYGLKRPAGYGNVPNYTRTVESVPENQKQTISEGIVVYDKAMTPEEIYSYELAVYKTPEEIFKLAIDSIDVSRLQPMVQIAKTAENVGSTIHGRLHSATSKLHARLFSNAPIGDLLKVMGQAVLMLRDARPSQEMTADEVVNQSLYLLGTDPHNFDQGWKPGQVIPINKTNLKPVVLREQPAQAAPTATQEPKPMVITYPVTPLPEPFDHAGYIDGIMAPLRDIVRVLKSAKKPVSDAAQKILGLRDLLVSQSSAGTLSKGQKDVLKLLENSALIIVDERQAKRANAFYLTLAGLDANNKPSAAHAPITQEQANGMIKIVLMNAIEYAAKDPSLLTHPSHTQMEVMFQRTVLRQINDLVASFAGRQPNETERVIVFALATVGKSPAEAKKYGVDVMPLMEEAVKKIQAAAGPIRTETPKVKPTVAPPTTHTYKGNDGTVVDITLIFEPTAMTPTCIITNPESMEPMEGRRSKIIGNIVRLMAGTYMPHALPGYGVELDFRELSAQANLILAFRDTDSKEAISFIEAIVAFTVECMAKRFVKDLTSLAKECVDVSIHFTHHNPPADIDEDEYGEGTGQEINFLAVNPAIGAAVHTPTKPNDSVSAGDMMHWVEPIIAGGIVIPIDSDAVGEDHPWTADSLLGKMNLKLVHYDKKIGLRRIFVNSLDMRGNVFNRAILMHVMALKVFACLHHDDFQAAERAKKQRTIWDRISEDAYRLPSTSALDYVAPSHKRELCEGVKMPEGAPKRAKALVQHIKDYLFEDTVVRMRVQAVKRDRHALAKLLIPIIDEAVLGGVGDADEYEWQAEHEWWTATTERQVTFACLVAEAILGEVLDAPPLPIPQGTEGEKKNLITDTSDHAPASDFRIRMVSLSPSTDPRLTTNIKEIQAVMPKSETAADKFSTLERVVDQSLIVRHLAKIIGQSINVQASGYQVPVFLYGRRREGGYAGFNAASYMVSSLIAQAVYDKQKEQGIDITQGRGYVIGFMPSSVAHPGFQDLLAAGPIMLDNADQTTEELGFDEFEALNGSPLALTIPTRTGFATGMINLGDWVRSREPLTFARNIPFVASIIAFKSMTMTEVLAALEPAIRDYLADRPHAEPVTRRVPRDGVAYGIERKRGVQRHEFSSPFNQKFVEEMRAIREAAPAKTVDWDKKKKVWWTTDMVALGQIFTSFERNYGIDIRQGSAETVTDIAIGFGKAIEGADCEDPTYMAIDYSTKDIVTLCGYEGEHKKIIDQFGYKLMVPFATASRNTPAELSARILCPGVTVWGEVGDQVPYKGTKITGIRNYWTLKVTGVPLAVASALVAKGKAVFAEVVGLGSPKDKKAESAPVAAAPATELPAPVEQTEAVSTLRNGRQVRDALLGRPTTPANQASVGKYERGAFIELVFDPSGFLNDAKYISPHKEGRRVRYTATVENNSDGHSRATPGINAYSLHIGERFKPYPNNRLKYKNKPTVNKIQAMIDRDLAHENEFLKSIGVAVYAHPSAYDEIMRQGQLSKMPRTENNLKDESITKEEYLAGMKDAIKGVCAVLHGVPIPQDVYILSEIRDPRTNDFHPLANIGRVDSAELIALNWKKVPAQRQARTNEIVDAYRARLPSAPPSTASAEPAAQPVTPPSVVSAPATTEPTTYQGEYTEASDKAAFDDAAVFAAIDAGSDALRPYMEPALYGAHVIKSSDGTKEFAAQFNIDSENVFRLFGRADNAARRLRLSVFRKGLSQATKFTGKDKEEMRASVSIQDHYAYLHCEDQKMFAPILRGVLMYLPRYVYMGYSGWNNDPSKPYEFNNELVINGNRQVFPVWTPIKQIAKYGAISYGLDAIGKSKSFDDFLSELKRANSSDLNAKSGNKTKPRIEDKGTGLFVNMSVDEPFSLKRLEYLWPLVEYYGGLGCQHTHIEGEVLQRGEVADIDLRVPCTSILIPMRFIKKPDGFKIKGKGPELIAASATPHVVMLNIMDPERFIGVNVSEAIEPRIYASVHSRVIWIDPEVEDEVRIFSTQSDKSVNDQESLRPTGTTILVNHPSPLLGSKHREDYLLVHDVPVQIAVDLFDKFPGIVSPACEFEVMRQPVITGVRPVRYPEITAKATSIVRNRQGTFENTRVNVLYRTDDQMYDYDISIKISEHIGGTEYPRFRFNHEVPDIHTKTKYGDNDSLYRMRKQIDDSIDTLRSALAPYIKNLEVWKLGVQVDIQSYPRRPTSGFVPLVISAVKGAYDTLIAYYPSDERLMIQNGRIAVRESLVSLNERGLSGIDNIITLPEPAPVTKASKADQQRAIEEYEGWNANAPDETFEPDVRVEDVEIPVAIKHRRTLDASKIPYMAQSRETPKAQARFGTYIRPDQAHAGQVRIVGDAVNPTTEREFTRLVNSELNKGHDDILPFLKDHGLSVTIEVITRQGSSVEAQKEITLAASALVVPAINWITEHIDADHVPVAKTTEEIAQHIRLYEQYVVVADIAAYLLKDITKYVIDKAGRIESLKKLLTGPTLDLKDPLVAESFENNYLNPALATVEVVEPLIMQVKERGGPTPDLQDFARGILITKPDNVTVPWDYRLGMTVSAVRVEEGQMRANVEAAIVKEMQGHDWLRAALQRAAESKIGSPGANLYDFLMVDDALVQRYRDEASVVVKSLLDVMQRGDGQTQWGRLLKHMRDYVFDIRGAKLDEFVPAIADAVRPTLPKPEALKMRVDFYSTSEKNENCPDTIFYDKNSTLLILRERYDLQAAINTAKNQHGTLLKTKGVCARVTLLDLRGKPQQQEVHDEIVSRVGAAIESYGMAVAAPHDSTAFDSKLEKQRKVIVDALKSSPTEADVEAAANWQRDWFLMSRLMEPTVKRMTAGAVLAAFPGVQSVISSKGEFGWKTAYNEMAAAIKTDPVDIGQVVSIFELCQEITRNFGERRLRTLNRLYMRDLQGRGGEDIIDPSAAARDLTAAMQESSDYFSERRSDFARFMRYLLEAAEIGKVTLPLFELSSRELTLGELSAMLDPRGVNANSAVADNNVEVIGYTDDVVMFVHRGTQRQVGFAAGESSFFGDRFTAVRRGGTMPVATDPRRATVVADVDLAADEALAKALGGAFTPTSRPSEGVMSDAELERERQEVERWRRGETVVGATPAPTPTAAPERVAPPLPRYRSTEARDYASKTTPLIVDLVEAQIAAMRPNHMPPLIHPDQSSIVVDRALSEFGATLDSPKAIQDFEQYKATHQNVLNYAARERIVSRWKDFKIQEKDIPAAGTQMSIAGDRMDVIVLITDEDKLYQAMYLNTDLDCGDKCGIFADVFPLPNKKPTEVLLLRRIPGAGIVFGTDPMVTLERGSFPAIAALSLNSKKGTEIRLSGVSKVLGEDLIRRNQATPVLSEAERAERERARLAKNQAGAAARESMYEASAPGKKKQKSNLTPQAKPVDQVTERFGDLDIDFDDAPKAPTPKAEPKIERMLDLDLGDAKAVRSQEPEQVTRRFDIDLGEAKPMQGASAKPARDERYYDLGEAKAVTSEAPKFVRGLEMHDLPKPTQAEKNLMQHFQSPTENTPPAPTPAPAPVQKPDEPVYESDEEREYAEQMNAMILGGIADQIGK